MKNEPIYARYIPKELIQKFNLPELTRIRELLQFRFAEGSSDVEMRLYHQAGFQDPVLYAHLTDTLNGQIHVLLYILNDPNAPRFNVDKMPDGSPTRSGPLSDTSKQREPRWKTGFTGRFAVDYDYCSLLPRHSRSSSPASVTKCISSNRLYKRNAVIFERYGFAYQWGRRQMEG